MAAIEVVVGIVVVVAPSVKTMGIVGLQDAHHIEGLVNTPLDTPPLMVGEDQEGITQGRRHLTLLLTAVARIGGILVALGEGEGEAPFNVLQWLLLVKDQGGWLCVLRISVS